VTRRKYELKRRAERQEETRRRIVEATVDLHSTLGPVRTTVSAIAERAGVQRHTVYRHFPEERELHMACSGLHMERHPLPDPEDFLAIEDGEERLRRALGPLYAYYERHEQLLDNVMRDLPVHEFTQEVFRLRFAPAMTRLYAVLVEGLPARRGARAARQGAAVAVALDFRTWQTLAGGSGLDRAEAVETAVAMVCCQ